MICIKRLVVTNRLTNFKMVKKNLSLVVRKIKENYHISKCFV